MRDGEGKTHRDRSVDRIATLLEHAHAHVCRERLHRDRHAVSGTDRLSCRLNRNDGGNDESEAEQERKRSAHGADSNA